MPDLTIEAKDLQIGDTIHTYDSRGEVFVVDVDHHGAFVHAEGIEKRMTFLRNDRVHITRDWGTTQ